MKLWKKAVACMLAVVMALTLLTACGGSGGGSGTNAAAWTALVNRTNELLADSGIKIEYSTALQSKAQIVANEVNRIPNDGANYQVMLSRFFEAVDEGIKKANLVQGEDWNLLESETVEAQAKELATDIQNYKQYEGVTVTAVGMANMTLGDEHAISVVYQYAIPKEN